MPVLAQLQPLVPYRLTHNAADEFTYVTGGKVDEIGYHIRNRDAVGSFANAFVLVDGQTTLRLSDIVSHDRFAQHVGRYGDRFVVAERAFTTTPPTPLHTSVNLFLHDGQTGVPITHNRPGQVAEANLLSGELLFTQSQFDSSGQTTPTRTDVHHFTSGGSVNLTNNAPRARSSIAPVSEPGAVFMITRYDEASPEQRDLLFSRLDGTTTRRLTDTVPGQNVYEHNVYKVGAQYLFRLNTGFTSSSSSDMYQFDGSTTVNLSNNPPGVHSSVQLFAGPDAIIYRNGGGPAPGTSFTDLYRYHDGILTAFTNNPPGTGSSVVETVGRTVYFHLGTAGTDTVNGRSNLHRNDGSTTSIRLTDNSAGMYMRLIRAGDNRIIEIRDNRAGVMPHQTSENLYVIKGDSSISLSSNPVGLHFRGDPAPLRGGFWFATEDFRGGTNANQKASDLFVYEHGTVRQLTHNGPGAASWAAHPGAGDDVVFHTTHYLQPLFVADRTDVLLFDGVATHNVTNFPSNHFGSFEGMLGQDLLITVSQSGSSRGPDLVRYTPGGAATPLTQNPPRFTSTVLEFRDARAVWMTTDHAQFPNSITGIFAGDGLTPTSPIFTPPDGQKMTLPFPAHTYGGLRFFSLEGGTGDDRFSNILAYVDGQVIPLTDNGPGWLAQLYLPLYIPNEYPPDAVIPEIALIALTTTSGDRRDVIVVLLPEPASGLASVTGMILALRRRPRRRLLRS